VFAEESAELAVAEAGQLQDEAAEKLVADVKLRAAAAARREAEREEQAIRLAEENQGIRRRIAERRRRSEDVPVAPPLSPVQVRAGELRHDLESAAAAAKLRAQTSEVRYRTAGPGRYCPSRHRHAYLTPLIFHDVASNICLALPNGEHGQRRHRRRGGRRRRRRR